jgi:predicted deacetylase
MFGRKELDDVHPRIMGVDDPHIKKSEWIWVIPLYMNDPVSRYPEWVNALKKTGKKIGLHGVYHTHREFGVDRSPEYIDKGISEFVRAFGYYPTHFKAPSLDLTEANREYLLSKGMKIMSSYNQIVHEVYHSPKHRLSNGKLVGE